MTFVGIFSLSHGCWVGVASGHSFLVTNKYSFHNTSFEAHDCCLSGVTVVLLACVVQMQCDSIMEISAVQPRGPALHTTFSPAQGSLMFEQLISRKLLILLFSTFSNNCTNLFDNHQSGNLSFKKKGGGRIKRRQAHVFG